VTGVMVSVYALTLLMAPAIAVMFRFIGLKRYSLAVAAVEFAATLGINVWQGAIAHDFIPAALSAAGLVITLALLWWRKRRDKIKAALGAKSRALREALVRRVRESAVPSPVLRPSLGGAR
jgi:uncharacterized membrane protein YccC